MNEQPPIDVVVLTIDRHEEIHECIDSVLAQDYPDFRLWVLDQGSNPETIQSLKERADRGEFTLHESEKIGVAAGRNLVYSMGSAPFIVSLDNDAVFSDSQQLKKVAAGFEGRETLGAIAFSVHRYYGEGVDLSCWGYPWPHESHFQKTFMCARFCGGAHAIRRNAFERAGGYDETFYFFGEDLDLSFALIASDFSIEYQPHIEVRHKASNDGRVDWKSGRLYHNARNMIYLNHKYFDDRLGNIVYAMGYLMKGVINGVPGDSWKGVRDGFRLTSQRQEPKRLDGDALAYVREYELEPRGSTWQRARKEALVRMRSTAGR